MRLFQSLLLLSQLAIHVLAQQWPLHDDGLNSVVQWDHFSMIVNGERLFLLSGEFHYWRIPVPDLWLDIMQKLKAAGFNAVSIYSHWGFHAASNGTLDFESGAHDVSKIFQFAKEVGLYVLWRPGPYINAETTGGGFPGWLLTGAYGSTRNDDARYTAAWTPYWEQMARIVEPHAITNGGPVLTWQVENEYGDQWLTDPTLHSPNETAIAYMELLEASTRQSGIDVPTLFNNPNMYSRSWSKDFDINHAGGDVDISGLDSYPSCWTCQLSVCAQYNPGPDFTTQDYYSNFQQTSPTQPSFLVEFQGMFR